MSKLNFVSNSMITLFKMYYEEGVENERIDLTPDTIPDIIIPALSKATSNEVILRLMMYLDMTDPLVNYVRADICAWDGVCCTEHQYKLFGDGSFKWDRKGMQIL